MFVLVGGQIGVLATIGLVLLTATTGMFLLRHQGFGVLTRIRAALDQGEAPAREMVHGVMIAMAGLLLLTPGFITDSLGLLLFVPTVRERVWSFLRRNITVVGVGGVGMTGAGRPRRERGPTIDLDPEDYRGEPDPGSPWRGPEDDRRG